jgi:hypothetical protein
MHARAKFLQILLRFAQAAGSPLTPGRNVVPPLTLI